MSLSKTPIEITTIDNKMKTEIRNRNLMKLMKLKNNRKLTNLLMSIYMKCSMEVNRR